MRSFNFKRVKTHKNVLIKKWGKKKSAMALKISMVSSNINYMGHVILLAGQKTSIRALRDHEQIIRVIFSFFLIFRFLFHCFFSAAILDYNIPDLRTQVTWGRGMGDVCVVAMCRMCTRKLDFLWRAAGTHTYLSMWFFFICFKSSVRYVSSNILKKYLEKTLCFKKLMCLSHIT